MEEAGPRDELDKLQDKLTKAASTRGSEGEQAAEMFIETLIGKPKGQEMKNLLQVLEEAGHKIKKSSFDRIDSNGNEIDFSDINHLTEIFPQLTFVEIKSTDRDLPDDFTGYFFSVSETEIDASISLGDQYRVLLFSKRTNNYRWTTVSTLLRRGTSIVWSASISLGEGLDEEE